MYNPCVAFNSLQCLHSYISPPTHHDTHIYAHALLLLYTTTALHLPPSLQINGAPVYVYLFKIAMRSLLTRVSKLKKRPSFSVYESKIQSCQQLLSRDNIWLVNFNVNSPMNHRHTKLCFYREKEPNLALQTTKELNIMQSKVRGNTWWLIKSLYIYMCTYIRSFPSITLIRLSILMQWSEISKITYSYLK